MNAPASKSESAKMPISTATYASPIVYKAEMASTQFAVLPTKKEIKKAWLSCADELAEGS
jgi:hypothetical protein